MDLSIIVPVYNVEDYLVRCLDSIFKQQGAVTFEVIAVEDRSTDRSLEILRSYQEKQPGLTVIEHDRNRRLSAARTTGMKAAKGRYIMHVDSDDWLLPGALAELRPFLERGFADVVIFNYAKANELGGLRAVRKIESKREGELHESMLPEFFRSCWSKVVKRDLTGDMVYHELSLNHSEDFVLGVEIFIRANTVMLVPGVYYAYFQNAASLTRTVGIQESIENRVHALEALVLLAQRYGPCGQVIGKALEYQVRRIHKRIAQHSLTETGDVEWEPLLRVIDELDKQQVLSQEITRSVVSVTARLRSLYKYWGPRVMLSYVINGLLFPREGGGWRRGSKRGEKAW